MTNKLIPLPAWWLLGLWILAALILPSLDLYPTISILDQRRIALVSLAGLSGLAYLLTTKVNGPTPNSIPYLPLLGVVALGALSTASATVHTYALLELSLFILVIVSIQVLSRATGCPRLITAVVLPALALTAVTYGLVTLMVLAAGWAYEGTPTWPEPIHNVVNIRFLNQWQSWMLPLIPALLIASIPRCRPWLFRSCLFLFMSFLWMLLFYSEGRGTLYAITGAACVIVILFGLNGLRWTAIQACAAACGLLLGVLILQMDVPGMPGTTGTSTPAISLDSPGRYVLWLVSLELIAENPWLGIGPMQFATLQLPIAAHPHSFPLQFAVEWGIPATLLLGGSLLWLFYRWVTFARTRVRSPECPGWETFYVISLTGALLTAGAHSLVSGIIVMPMSQIMLILTAGLALGWYRRYREGSTLPRWFRISAPVWRITVLSAIIWLWGFGALELANHAYNDQAGITAADGPYQARFWAQGKLIHLMQEEPKQYNIRDILSGQH